MRSLLYRSVILSLCFCPLAAFASFSSLPEAPAQTAVQQAIPAQLPTIYIERTLTLKKNQPLATLLKASGFSKDSIFKTLKPLNTKKNYRRALRSMKPGQKITVRFKETSKGATPELTALTFHTRDDKTVRVQKNDAGAFKAVLAPRKLETTQEISIGTINSSLYKAAQDANLPASLVKSFANLFAWELDFTRDIRPGATFKVVYQKIYDADGEFIRNGKILAASLKTKGKNHFAFRHEHGRRVGYYDEKGLSKRKSLLRTPLEFTRISSGFNLKRKHPILGYTRAHKGTDFAAPTGTPIKASGDGVIEKAGWNGGYGRYIRIKHNKTYKTAYAHLSRYARGMRAGKKVHQGQVIGYVGTSGRSTGPHLHYEVLVNNRQVNAMKVKLPNGDPLRGESKTAFMQSIAQYKDMWQNKMLALAKKEGGAI